jgi:hypothetical protein
MFDRYQFRDLIIRTLTEMGIPSRSATELLMGTCAQESQFGTFFRQIHGPALGCMQIESDTFDWLRQKYYPKYSIVTRMWFECLEWDIRSSIIMARLKYLSCPGAIPTTLEGQAAYWNRYYNANPVFGTDEEYIANYKKYCD